MIRFSRGLALLVLCLALWSCAQDKKLPVGERLSVLDNNSGQLDVSKKSISSLPYPVLNNSWSQNGGNSNHIASNLKAGATLKEIWIENFGKGINKRNISLAAPVVLNNRIFVMDANGLVSAFNFKNGTRLWENNLSVASKNFKETKSRASGLAIDNNLLFATTGFGGVYAMDAITGAPKWRKVLEAPIRISPTITPNMLLVQTVDNKLYALDKMTGNELWRFGVAFEDTVIAGGASPAYDAEDNIVVAGFSNGEIVVLNATVGTPLWSHMLVSNRQVNYSTEINTIGSFPIIQDGSIFAISNSNTLTALDIRTGDVLWNNEIGSMQNMLLVGEYLFVISNKNVLYAIDKNSGDIAWDLDIKPYITDEDIKGEVYASQPVMINNNLFLAFSNGLVFKINAKDGQLMAKTNLGVDISNGLVVVNGRVIAISDNADIIVFE
ncbi:MAG: PQQ-binding-like beta-propeller repeat protein [Alphaproteobacteria bacterium]|nr:PQQ-binding-like beta-propeller repeat protein [Alphaproteobacteria bacterium]